MCCSNCIGIKTHTHTQWYFMKVCGDFKLCLMYVGWFQNFWIEHWWKLSTFPLPQVRPKEFHTHPSDSEYLYWLQYLCLTVCVWNTLRFVVHYLFQVPNIRIHWMRLPACLSNLKALRFLDRINYYIYVTFWIMKLLFYICRLEKVLGLICKTLCNIL